MPIQCTCRLCGRVFFVGAGAFKQRGGAPYCSYACSRRARRSGAEHACEQCGGAFWVMPYQRKVGRGLYCSQPCLAAAQSAAAEPRMLDRFWAKVDKQGPVPPGRPDLGPCWLWTGTIGVQGYGLFSFKSRNRTAHQVSWMIHGLPALGPGIDRDHLCRVRRCVNPGHLEAVPHAENVRRGRAASIRNQGRCRRGHLVTEENGYRSPAGYLLCRVCRRAARRAWLERGWSSDG